MLLDDLGVITLLTIYYLWTIGRIRCLKFIGTGRISMEVFDSVLVFRGIRCPKITLINIWDIGCPNIGL